MALNDTFTIQEINLDKKELLYDPKKKNLNLFGISNVQSIQLTNISKFFVINSWTFRYSYAWFLHNVCTRE